MKYVLLPLLLLASVASLRAVAPVPYTLPVTYSGKVQLSGTGEAMVVIYSETGGPWSWRNTSGEASVELVWLRPRKQYQVRCSGVNASDFWASFNAPDGYAIYIDGQPTNLMSFHGMGASFDEWATFELRPIANDGRMEMGAFTGLQVGDSVTWEMGLGGLKVGGRSAGRVLFKELHLSPVSPEPPIDSRDRLHYAPPGNYGEIYVVRDGPSNQRIRQIGTPIGVADFVDQTNGYEIRIYPQSHASWNGSMFTFSGAYSKTIRVASPAANQLRIVDTEGGLSRVWWLRLDSGSISSGTYKWILNEGKHVSGTDTWERVTEHVSMKSGSTRENVVTVSHPGSNDPLAKTKFVYQAKPWGAEALTQVVADPDSAQLTTQYAYHETPPNTSNELHRGNYRRVKSIVGPTGGWVTFEYYDDWNRRGQLYKQVQPYKDSALANPTDGVVTTFDYVAGWSGRHTRPSVRTEEIGGVTTGRTEWTHGDITGSGWPREHTTIKAYGDNTNFQTSYIERFRGDAGFDEPFLPLDQKNPDDARVVFSRANGTYNPSSKVFTVTHGDYHHRELVILATTDGTGAQFVSTWGGQSFNLAYLIPNKSVLNARIFDRAGNVLRTETYIYVGSGNFTSAPVAFEDFTYDAQGRLTERVASNGAQVSYTYVDGRVASVTGADGVLTEFVYDSLGRVVTRTKKGASSWTINGYTHPAQGDLVSSYLYQTDATGLVVVETVTDGSLSLKTTTRHDRAGRVVSKQEYADAALSLTTQFAYDLGGRKVTTTLPGGATRVSESFPDGQVFKVSGNGAVAEDYTYWVDSNGQRRKRTVLGGNTAAWNDGNWDWLGRKVQEWTPRWDGNNWAKTWHYDNKGRLWKITQPGSAPTLYHYNTLGERISEGLDLNANNWLDPNSSDRFKTYANVFHSDGTNWWLKTEVGVYATNNSPTHSVLGTVYERVSGITGATRKITHTYDVFGNLTMDWYEVDRTNKRVTRNVVKSDSNIAEQYLIQNGLAVAARDTAGVVQRTEYDGLARPYKKVDPRKGASVTTFYPHSNLVYHIRDPFDLASGDPNQRQRTFEYYPSGRVKSVRNVLGNFAYFEYDGVGRKIREWGPITNPVEYVYNGSGQQIEMKTFRAGTGWNVAAWPGTQGNPGTSTGAADTTEWVYHPATNLLERKIDAKDEAVVYTYTVAGQTHTRTWARGVQTTYGYDGNTGELTSVDYSDSTPDLTYTYNRFGQMATVADTLTGSRTLNHCLCGKLVEEILTSYFEGRKLHYTLETSGGGKGRTDFYRILSSSNTEEFKVDYTYGADGRLTNIASIVPNSNPGTVDRKFDYAYVANSHLTQGVGETVSGYGTHRAYDAHRDLFQYSSTTISGQEKAVFFQIFDTMGRLWYSAKWGEMFAHFPSGNPVTQYGYNERSEVVLEKTFDGWSSTVIAGRDDSYLYDNMGNRTSATHNGDTATYARDELNRYTSRTVPGYFDVALIASTGATVTVNGSSAGVVAQGGHFFKKHPMANGSTAAYDDLTIADGIGPNKSMPAFVPKTEEVFEYDEDGNLTDDGRWTYTYDAENRLRSMETRAAALSAGVPGQRFDFAYDYLGRRVGKVAFTLSNSVWTAVKETRFLYEGWNLIAEYAGNYNGGNFPSAVATRHFLWGKDLSGTMQGAGGVGGLLMIQDGSERYLPAYDTNGNVHAMIKASNGAIAVSYEYDAFGRTLREHGEYKDKNPFRFSTKYTDLETGLIYYGLRYYSPSMGRFINRDPIGERGGLNLYAFVRNNGVNGWDYLGLENDGPGSPGYGHCQNWGWGIYGLGYYCDPEDMYNPTSDLDGSFFNREDEQEEDVGGSFAGNTGSTGTGETNTNGNTEGKGGDENKAPNSEAKWDDERCGQLIGIINNLLSETGKMISDFDEYRKGYKNLIALSYVGQTFSVASFGTAVRSIYQRAIKSGRSAVAGRSGEILDYGDDYAARGPGWTGTSWDPQQVIRDHDHAAFQTFAFQGGGRAATEGVRLLAGDALLSAALLDAAGYAEKTIERGNAVLDAASTQMSLNIRGNHSMVKDLQSKYDENCK